MKTYTREEVLARLRAKKESGKLILATGAGTGISAKFEEKGGSDLILVFNSGHYRMDGLGSLSGLMAYGDANAIALEMGERQVLPVVKETPVICSINGTDPTRVLSLFMDRVMSAGFSGINNFPTVGLIDGKFRAALEQIGLGYRKEVELVALANKKNVFSMPYAFDLQEAKDMLEAGCDALVLHFGLTVGGSIGATDSVSIDEAARFVEKTRAMMEKMGSRSFLLCHGGPLENAADVQKLIDLVPFDGFVGASSIERLPVEGAIVSACESFSSLSPHAKGK